VSLNISLSHSRSLKVIETGSIRKLEFFLFAFDSASDILIDNHDFFLTPALDDPVIGSEYCRLVRINWNGVASRL